MQNICPNGTISTKKDMIYMVDQMIPTGGVGMSGTVWGRTIG